jgi:putative glutamine amidotransferase
MSKLRAGVTFGNSARVGPYERALREAGIESVRNPASLEGLDGLLLTGGSDVNPKLYGQPRAAESEEADDARDGLEMKLLQEALEADLPVLAICRGLQLLNVAQGGTLIQHLASSDVHRVKAHDAAPGRHPAVHSIRVKPDTRLAGIIGAGEHDVNSRHHQAVERVGKDLVVSAIAADGVIEALELTGNAAFAVAVQWHPEDRVAVNAADRKLFEAFALAMAQRTAESDGRTSRSTAAQLANPLSSP